MQYFLGLDIGGTSLKLGAWENERRLAWQDGIPVPTGVDPAVVLDEIARGVRSFAATFPSAPLALGVGSCGMIHSGMIHQSPNTEWDELPVEMLLEQRLGYPVCLINDADAFLLAVLAAESSINSAIGITLGTGIGTAVWIEGRLIAGGSGVSPEGGHITLNVDGEDANTGIPGTWESLACKDALMRYYQQAGGSGAHDPAEVAAQAVQGLVTARTAWARFGHFAGAGLGSLCNLFSPEIVFIGGGLAGAHQWFEGPLAAALHKHMLQAFSRPKIVYIDSQPDAVAYGAARYASILEQHD